MIINLSPQRRDDQLAVSKAGDVLTIDGEVYDFGPLAEGDTLPRDGHGCDWIVGDVTRTDGQIVLTLVLPHGPTAPEETRFPQPLIDVPDGPLALPAYDEVP
jgi:hypothetical protein